MFTIFAVTEPLSGLKDYVSRGVSNMSYVHERIQQIFTISITALRAHNLDARIAVPQGLHPF